MRLGGVGFTSSGDPTHAAAAYASALAVTVRHIGKTPLIEFFGADTFAKTPTGIALSIALKVLHTAHEFPYTGTVRDGLPRDVSLFFRKFMKAASKDTKGLQGEINRALQLEHHARILAASTVQEIAVLESRKTPSSSAWMKALPSTLENTLTESVKSGLVLATNTLPLGLPTFCACGQELSAAHLVSCQTGSGKLLRHNMVCDAFKTICAFHGQPTELVPRMTYEDCKGCLIPDGKTYTLEGIVQWDVSVTAPDSLSNAAATAKAGGSALLKREKEKIVKYREKARSLGQNFIPLVFETHGRPGADVRNFLRQVTSSAGIVQSLPVSDCLMQLQLQLLRGNSLMASACIVRARFHHARESGAKYNFLGN
jgi:hypothetical protein